MRFFYWTCFSRSNKLAIMARNILPEPPAELKQLSRRLCRRIEDAMADKGQIPFSRYMEMALYEPGLGYYSAGLHKFGESGDFVTAPEMGSLFAACLSRQAAQLGEELGPYEVLEIGAGSGRLAADFLNETAPQKGPERYRILERSADLRAVQRAHIQAVAPRWLDRIEWIDEPPAEDWQGLLMANEVIDALAVERFQISDGAVERLCVKSTADGFGWSLCEAPESLEIAVRHVESTNGSTLADGYRSEIQPHLPAWLQSVTGRMQRGLALFIDYGYPRSEYYLPERRDGTLMCHYRHRAHDDVFFWPGLQDITAWVDFTALAEAADECGLDVEGYCTQAMFLIGCGLDDALSTKIHADDSRAVELSAEVRQLTLPGAMGERFQVMGVGRGLETAPRGFSVQDLRYRL
jgi:SAM-dependent MidA family methyltransferase